ncbi:GD20145, partial [Drosophila simulans]
KGKYNGTLKQLREQLFDVIVATKDPWRCAPHAVLQEQGVYKEQPACLTLGHEALQRPKRRILGQYEEYVVFS